MKRVKPTYLITFTVPLQTHLKWQNGRLTVIKTITKTIKFAKVNDITLEIYLTIPTANNRQCIRASSLYVTSVGNRCSKSSFPQNILMEK